MRKSFFARFSLPILLAVFFLAPFGVRGARMSMLRMQNDVKDWLPASFAETAEMDWFWARFKGERFILASWDGCRADDPSYKLFLKKLEVESPPSQRADPSQRAEPLDDGEAAKPDSSNRLEQDDTPRPTAVAESEAARISRQLHIASEPAEATSAAPTTASTGHMRRLERPTKFIGDELRLFHTGNEYFDWGGRKEKWLQGKDQTWYFLTPDGDLCRWDSGGPIESAFRLLWRKVAGGVIEGERVAAFSPEDAAWYYENPKRLTAQLFRTVTTGPDMLHELTRSGGVLSGNEEEAHRRLDGLLFGADGKQTCMLITLTEAGLADLHQVAGRGMLGRPRGRLHEIAEECGISEAELRLGGPPIDNIAIDEEGTITLVRLVSMCALLGFGLAYACFRSVPATLMIFFVGGMAAVLSLALVGWMGATLDAVLMSMPALVYVLGISGAVHLINYYREAVEEDGPVGAAGKAIAHGWKPAVLCSVTTALGLLSLCTSDITPISKFGLFSALGVVATLLLLFTFLPAALEFLPPKLVRSRREETWLESSLSGFWGRFGGFIMKHHYAVAAACTLVVAVVGWGVTRIDTSINLLELFDRDAKILNDYAWLESNLGKLVPMEVVVSFPADSLRGTKQGAQGASRDDAAPMPVQYSFLERLELIDHIQHVVDQEFGSSGRKVAGPSMSAVTFSPVLPAAQGDRFAFTRRSATNNRLEANRSAFLKSDFLRIDPDNEAELWRISLRIAALQNVDYGQFVNDVKAAVEPILAAQHYREQILLTVSQDRDRGDYAGAYVCLLASRGDVVEEASRDKQRRSGAASRRTPVNQTRIFATTLEKLLAASRVEVDWLDPSDLKTAKDANVLSDYACVAHISGALADKSLPSQAKQFIDARDHRYQSADLADRKPHAHLAAPAKAETVKTAAKTSAAGATQASRRVHAVYTGVAPIVYKAQRTLLNSLIESTFWSFVTISPLMMFLSRGPRAGLVAMLPNALPVLVIFGSMGWLGVKVDIGSMMTASIALGVAVDDTIHYLTWFRWELNKTGDRRQAILAAYRRCATPTLQTAVISGLGLSIFVFSTFTPTQRFGYLMLTILLAGVVAELVFFPALLAGPLGRYFKPSKQKPKDANEGDGPAPSSSHVVSGSGAMPAPHFHLRHDAAVRRDDS